MEFLLDILEEHIEEADFLYTQRRAALQDDDYNLVELAALEERLLAHIDGLVVAGSEGWSLLEELLTSDDEGEAFVAGLAALASGAPDRRDALLQAFQKATEETLAGLQAAICLFGAGDLVESLRDLVADAEAETAAAVLKILAFDRRGLEPDELAGILESDDPSIRDAGLQAAAAMGWRQFAGRCDEALQSEDPQRVIGALRAAFILGHDSGLDRARSLLAGGDPLAAEVQIWLGLAGNAADLALLQAGLDGPELARDAVIALGWLGRPEAVENLLNRLGDNDLDRQIGAAVRRITGVDLEAEGLLSPDVEEVADEEPDADEKPDSGDEEPTEDDFEDPPLDLDEALPWPDPDRLKAWWQENRGRFAAGARFRWGQSYDQNAGFAMLREGGLQERGLAACELARFGSAEALFETRALAWHQSRRLARISGV